MSEQLELFDLKVEALTAPASKRDALLSAIKEQRWIRYPGRTCSEETCPHYKYDSKPWGSCDEDSYGIIGGPMIGSSCMATYFPGEGPRPARPGEKEHCQTCARFDGCKWWQWSKPCRNYQADTMPAPVDDYAEEYCPGAPCCGECVHCDEGRPWPGWRHPSYCPETHREVSRSTGLCGRFKEKEV